MAEINQPTPIKPVWPVRRDETPHRRHEGEPEEEEEKRPAKPPIPTEKRPNEDEDGHQIDEYA